MTVVHILIGFGGGGMENFVLHLSKKYLEKNINVIAVGVTAECTVLAEFQDAGITCVGLGITSVFTFFKGLQKLFQLIRKIPDAFIHAHGFHALMLGCFIRLWRPAIPMVFTLHNNVVRKPYRRFLLFFTRRLRKADIIFSDDAKAWYHKSKSIVIPNGVDTQKFNVTKQLPDVFTYLFVGRLDEAKNPLYLVDLAKELEKEGEFKIVVAGIGDLLSPLQQKIARFNLQDKFEYVGYRKDTPQLMSKAHCIIMPSLWEGMPIVVLEAGASRTPIISTPVGSIPTVLNNGNAHLGSLEQFPAMMKDVYHNYGKAQDKADILQKTIQVGFSIEAAADKHLDLYNKFYYN